jgi:hypothetical protein
MWFYYINFKTLLYANSFKISFWLGLFSAFIGCGGYKFSFGLVGRILLAKIGKLRSLD